MAHVFQVGVGSGGMPVLDMIGRDPRIHRLTLVDPDVYKPHNVQRHLFPVSAIGQLKVQAARDWLLERRPELEIELLPVDLLAPDAQPAIESAVQGCDIAVCAVDVEPAKYHFDALMRRHGKPWTLGEVLSGGIGGFVHQFIPGGPCYGCVCSFLKRSVTTEKEAAPDYSNPAGTVVETTIPASKASITVIASLHALLTLQLLEASGDGEVGFTSLLWTLRRVPGVFDEAFRPYRFKIARLPECLLCHTEASQLSGAELNAAVDDALSRLS